MGNTKKSYISTDQCKLLSKTIYFANNCTCITISEIVVRNVSSKRTLSLPWFLLGSESGWEKRHSHNGRVTHMLLVCVACYGAIFQMSRYLVKSIFFAD